MTEGFDIGLEMSGNAHAFRSMIDAMVNGGRISLLGIFGEDAAIDWGKVIFKGLFLKGIYGREMFETWYKMTAMIQSGLDISGVITHRFPIEEYQKGFEAMNSGQSGKVVLDWGLLTPRPGVDCIRPSRRIAKRPRTLPADGLFIRQAVEVKALAFTSTAAAAESPAKLPDGRLRRPLGTHPRPSLRPLAGGPRPG